MVFEARSLAKLSKRVGQAQHTLHRCARMEARLQKADQSKGNTTCMCEDAPGDS
jgi:hypothetical protein